jgi:hypothetical protein
MGYSLSRLIAELGVADTGVLGIEAPLPAAFACAVDGLGIPHEEALLALLFLGREPGAGVREVGAAGPGGRPAPAAVAAAGDRGGGAHGARTAEDAPCRTGRRACPCCRCGTRCSTGGCTVHEKEEMKPMESNPLRVGIGGPVGSGKTALCEMLCRRMRERYDMAVITNDIYTREDMEILLRADALPPERLMGVETGGCPHTAIREDASINLEAIARLQADFPRCSWCWSSRAATTWPPPSARSCRT